MSNYFNPVRIINTGNNRIDRTKIGTRSIFGFQMRYNIQHTFRKITPKKRGTILKDKNEIISLIKNNINNNDYLMIKGSNSTGLYRLANNLKKGNLHVL